MKPLSIQLYTVREDIEKRGVVPVLQDIAKIGYKGVEGSGFGMSPAEFRKVVEDLGMVVSSTWGGINTPDEVDQLIETAQGLGTSYTAGGFWIDQLADVDAIAKTADILNMAIPRLNAAGIEFGLHNHWMEYEMRGDKLAIEHLMERCPVVTFELDIYWCGNFGAHKPHEVVKRFADRIVLLHVKDGPQTDKDANMTAVGHGTVDVKQCIANANPTRLGWHIVELDRFDGVMMDAVRDSYTYLVGNGLSAGNVPV